MEEDKLNNKINLEETAPETVTSEEKKLPPKKFNWRILGIVLGVLVLLAGLGVVFGLLPALAIKDEVLLLADQAQGISVGLQAQDLNQAIEHLAATQQTLDRVEQKYRRLVWLKPLPWVGSFYQDGQHLLNGGNSLLEAGEVAIEALKPYGDLLGLDQEGEESSPSGVLTAQERLLLALDTLDKIQPSLDQIGEKLTAAQVEIDQIDPQRYPEELLGKKIREKVVLVIQTIDNTAQLANEVKPIVGYLKPLLGFPKEKRYLLLFQNDAELRPTGGFLTAYAILSVDQGQIKPLGSYDIYTLDARFGNRVAAPQPIKDYHKNVYYWHLRDMNLSPDFKVSMETFLENYDRIANLDELDGVIALDTKFLVSLLEVLGPIGVGGWGNFSAEVDPRCNCPQVFYELELLADKPLGVVNEARKAFIGPLMHSILLNMMQSPRKMWPEFFNLFFTETQEKHLLFYFMDEEIQKAIEAVNAAGRIKDFEGDYLHINDCNFAGAKSNMFIQVEVVQEIEKVNGEVIKTVTIDYRNPEPPSNCNLEAGELCLNGLYRDWVRLYVPEGSQLIEATGSEIEVRAYEDLGKTVFEAFYGDESPLRPQGKAKLVFKYKLPFDPDQGQGYPLLIQKQPGTAGYQYQVSFNGETESFELTTDKELRF